MKKHTRIGALLLLLLSSPLLAYAGEGKEGLLLYLGAGATGCVAALVVYTAVVLVSAALIRSGPVLLPVVAGYTLLLVSAESWALRQLSTFLWSAESLARANAAPGLHPLAQRLALLIAVLAAVVLGGATLIWTRKRNRFRREQAAEESLRGW